MNAIMVALHLVMTGLCCSLLENTESTVHAILFNS